MAKCITQETFDEVVKENMEDFGLDKLAAAEDAVEQFKSQGADLSMVDTSADGIRKDAKAALIAHVDKLRDIDVGAEGDSKSECLEALSAIGELCRGEGGAGEASKIAFGEVGGVGVVARFLDGDKEDSSLDSLVLVSLSALHDACTNSERNRDAFIYTNMDQLTSLLTYWTGVAGASNSDHNAAERTDGLGASEGVHHQGTAEDNAVRIAAGLRLVRAVCTKVESNKGNFMRRQGGEILVATLRRHGSGECKDGAVIKEAAGAIRSVTLGDDCRKDFSGTYDNMKALVSKGAVPQLLKAARAFEEDSSTLAWVYLALKQLATNDESVKLIVEKGGLNLVSEAIVRFSPEVAVCRTALSLFRNISANDALKTRLLSEGGLRLVLGCMSEHKDDKLLQEHGCATMAAMALRSPSNGAQIVAEGGVAALLSAMRRHPTAQSLQRQACLCIRNIAARGPTLRAGMLDEGCESSLREAGKLRGCVDEAYGALRDLECEVSLVTMGEGGKMQVGVQAFGAETANFNPSLKETGGLSERIEGSATAPKHAGFKL